MYAIFSPGFETTWAFKIEGLILHLIGSILFVALIFIVLKPSILIAKHIAEFPAKAEPGHLRLKVLNSSVFSAHDLQINVYKIERINLSGADIRATLLGHYEGMQQGVNYLQSAFRAMFESTKTNALQLRFKSIMKDDNADNIIREILDSTTCYLEIHISLRHGLSGIVGNSIKRYNNITSIKRGVYKHGFSLKIDS
jgi:hypothetical protein